MLYDQGTPHRDTESTRSHHGKKSIAALVVIGGLVTILGIEIQDQRQVASAPSPTPS